MKLKVAIIALLITICLGVPGFFLGSNAIFYFLSMSAATTVFYQTFRILHEWLDWKEMKIRNITGDQ